MNHFTAFSFGYEGWGPHTLSMMAGFDKVEATRGFKPPIVVDTRIRRAVRAPGFQGNALGKLIGNRYVWMRDLGNRSILTGDGGINIMNPAAAADLLKCVLDAAEQNRRVVFFCSCGPLRGCHREVVGSLLLKEARRQGIDLEVVEWPGEAPQTFEVPVSTEIIKKVSKGRKSVPLPDESPLWFGTPWYSTAVLSSPELRLPVLTGPASANEGWHLPVLSMPAGGDALPNVAQTCRFDRGLEPRSNQSVGPTPVHPFCVYHIRHSQKLASIAAAPGGRGDLVEKGDWRPVLGLLQEADLQQERLLIIFDNAEEFVGVNWVGTIENVLVHEDAEGELGCTLQISGFRQMSKTKWLPRSELRLRRTGKLLNPGYLRGKLICYTPEFLLRS